MKKFLLLQIAVLNLLPTQGQTEYFGTFNPCNFSYTSLDSLPAVKWLKAPSATFDYVNQRYMFIGSSDAKNWKFYTLDARNGRVISKPDFPGLSDPLDNVVNCLFSNSRNRLLALHWNNFQRKEYLVSLNSSTGAITIIDSLPGVAAIGGLSTIDEVNNRYIFRGADNLNNWHLYSVNTRTGKILSNPPYPKPDGNIVEYHYSNSLNKLLALHWDNASGTEFLAEINPADGTFTDLFSLPGVAWIKVGYTFVDDYRKRYVFYGGDKNGNWYLYSIDALSGKTACSPSFPVFPDDDNIVMPQTNPLTGITYALHWETHTGTTGSRENMTVITDFFPNPFTDQASITLDKSYKEINVFIYNNSGQLVKKISAENTAEIQVARDNLANGQYFLSVICDHVYRASIKTVIN